MDVGRMARAARVGLAVGLIVAVGCDGGGGEDAGLIPADGGGRRDAGAVDAGAPPEDAGAPTEDAGGGADAGDAVDAGAGADAGATPDAGSGDDAGVAADGGVGLDGGIGLDAALGLDGGAPTGSTPTAGDLVIVEVQGNPVRATDEEAEYIEVLNVSGRTLDLMGVQLAHRNFTGGEPAMSNGFHTIASSVVVADGDRVLLTRSGGGFFGGATRDYVYDGFVFENGTSSMAQNRIRLMVPSWDRTEPPDPADVIDGVVFAPGTFDNDTRGRSLQLDPTAVGSPTAASNDDPSNWCVTATAAPLAYRTDNYGTPRAANDCE